MTPGAPPNANYGNSNYLFPTDTVAQAQASVSPPTPGPPITRHVTMPEKVSVKYMAELSRQPRYAIIALMIQLGISADRSVAFEDAAQILRRYGIAVERMT